MLNELFKSVIDADEAPVVICDTAHTVVYMNPAAVKNYAKSGGETIVGRSIFDCHGSASRLLIERVVEWFGASAANNKVHTFYNAKQNKDVYMIALRDGGGRLIGYYEKHEYRSVDKSPMYEI